MRAVTNIFSARTTARPGGLFSTPRSCPYQPTAEPANYGQPPDYLFMWSYSYTGSGNAFLERSDDDGRTWMRADRGLAGLNTFWYPQLLDASGDTIGALVGATSDLWITRNAGASWQRIGPIVRAIGGIQVVVSDLVTEASFGPAPRTCRCAFAVSSSDFLGSVLGGRYLSSRDYTHWSPLPPIPVEGASASRSGVFQILGPAADGRLLALGAEPERWRVCAPRPSRDCHRSTATALGLEYPYWALGASRDANALRGPPDDATCIPMALRRSSRRMASYLEQWSG